MYKVMIVDDDVNVRKCLRRLIPWDAIGCTLVAEASDGEEGMGYFLEKRPDAVITDLRMPGMDGDVFCKKIRTVSDKCAIILLSAYESFTTAQLLMHYGVMEYILKPVTAQTVDQITELLKGLAGSTRTARFLYGLVHDNTRREHFLEEIRRKNTGYFQELFRSLTAGVECDFTLLRTAAGVMLKLLYQAMEESGMDGAAADQKRQQAFAALDTYSRKMDVVSFLIERFEEFLTGTTQPAPDDPNSSIVDQIKAFVLENISDSQLNIPMIANHFDFSVDYVGRLFKKSTGVTLIAYISSVRLNQAARLLRDTRFSVAEVAKMVGYSNPSYFCRVFKNQTGLSPNDYRNNQNPGESL